ncbi:L-serine ammonia-lyase [Zhihengliuella salsuginis]|uniref:L-serine dehydratase n=1 Tax=Zhihengliuella salsuginis TaxID=578222 RepID=A0ABQ3GL11_9MICC|nr:L-serine ammonia-lyase [Zhihengliuella salsuginis]GHD13562.1 L-serine dehydratase [Zhihengliuella salsuginis]
MALGVLDLFSVGIGPSSSHTVGPMRAARRFTAELEAAGASATTARVKVELFGSLGATGIGHGSDTAVVVGLCGHDPETVDADSVASIAEAAAEAGRLALGGTRQVAFNRARDVVLHRRRSLPAHPNGMRVTAFDDAGEDLFVREYYSVGGGFVVASDELDAPVAGDEQPEPRPFDSADELLDRCREGGLSIADLMRANEAVRHEAPALREQLLGIWAVMRECVANGCTRTEALLPGGLKVRRRAPALRDKLREEQAAALTSGGVDPLQAMEWVNLFALAVNEENASGGRIVTAPTNGAAGIIPAVLHYYWNFIPGADEDGVVDFLLTAGAIGILFKKNASISGAEVGCQGEVGSACSMAAAGLCAVLGGTPEQIENAAEIGLEHNMGLTCDPVGGLVQVPCIERNAIASVKAINAARLAFRGDGQHRVSLDQAINTMRQTGADMKTKYKETSRGGLAVNVVEC